MIGRTFLRICALEALRPSALLGTPSPEWPTLASDFVFDSRLDPIDEFKDDTARFVVSIFTGDDEQSRVAQSGPVLYESAVELLIVIAVIGRVRQDNAYVCGLAYSDLELEADLDLVEQQVWWALHFGSSGSLFRKMAKMPFESWLSTVERSAEEGARMAMRTIKVKVPLREQCYQGAPTAPLVGFARLPSGLKEIAESLGASTYLRDIARAVADASPTMPVPPRLKKVAVKIGADAAPIAEDSGAVVEIRNDTLDG